MDAVPAPASIINNLISQLPVILPSAIAIVTLMTGYKLGKRQSALNLITAKKIEWRDSIRDELADFIRDNNELLHLYFIYSKDKPDDLKPLSSKVSKILANGQRLILRINPSEYSKIIDVINKITECGHYSHDSLKNTTAEWEALVSELAREARIMLDKEWEKIKAEAGHKKPWSLAACFRNKL